MDDRQARRRPIVESPDIQPEAMSPSMAGGRPPSAWIRFEAAGARLLADPAGVLIWPERSLLVVADLHLEKGTSFARRGALLPPYDTRRTLARLRTVIARFAPQRVISLGDGFHDGEASARLRATEREALGALMTGREWLWVTGNHDPLPPEGLGGQSLDAAEIGGLVFRHLPGDAPAAVEIAGHLHPKAAVAARGRRVSRACFVADHRRVILPAFGTYTGGLDLLDPAFAGLFPEAYQAFLLGRGRLHVVARRQIERAAA
jgi:DNA ligase-associated metallophosphoesterase